jgi:aarF domain-containing kinase
MTFDNATLAEITKEWGVNSPDMFASATLMKPYEGGDGSTKARVMEELSGATPADRHYEAQQRMFQGIRDVLGDETKWPRGVIFIGRNMRIVQGNNQFLGSPVNRVKMTGAWASRSLVDSPDLTYRERFTNGWHHLIFKFVLFTSDVVFYTSKVRQWLGLGGGMEDDMEQHLKSMAKDFGLELQHDIFEG